MGCEPTDTLVLKGMDKLHNLPGEFNLVRCGSCGLMRTNPRPSPASMGYYYPDEYGPYKSTLINLEKPEQGAQATQPSPLKEVLIGLLGANTNVLPNIPPGRALEIGCASGGFMNTMNAHGWEVEGLEFGEVPARIARELGYKVQTSTLEEAQHPSSPYDLIVGWMVVEHLHSPLQGLEKLASWAKPGGWLAISVPDAGSLEFKMFRKNWYALQLPSHLYHYTPKTITALLAKAGWEVSEIKWQRCATNLLVSAGYALQNKRFCTRASKTLIAAPNWSGWKRQLVRPLAILLGWTHQSGRMTILAKKASATR